MLVRFSRVKNYLIEILIQSTVKYFEICLLKSNIVSSTNWRALSSFREKSVREKYIYICIREKVCKYYKPAVFQPCSPPKGHLPQINRLHCYTLVLADRRYSIRVCRWLFAYIVLWIFDYDVFSRYRCWRPCAFMYCVLFSFFFHNHPTDRQLNNWRSNLHGKRKNMTLLVVSFCHR